MKIRCPSCRRLVATGNATGELRLFCRRCKTTFGSISTDLPRLSCRCGKWLLSGVITGGQITSACHSCLEVSTFGPGGRQKVMPAAPPSDAGMLALIEDRWSMLRIDRASKSVDLAVGIRFDVFSRDGFRCRYCGRGLADGVMLEVDHVLARSRGGTDTLDNLLTACWDCNRGKSDKIVDSHYLTA